MRLRALGLLAVLALMAASCGGVLPEAGGPSEGIQVHGDWTIDIYNEDGSLDRSLTFSNGLLSNGAAIIASALAGQSTIGVWGVTIAGANGVELCPSGPDVNGGCWIPVTRAFTTTEDLAGDSARETLRLSGSTTVEVDGSIAAVSTNVGSCEPSVAPADCFPVNRDNGFTAKTLDEDGLDPIPVIAGQQVQVQVDISFTSG